MRLLKRRMLKLRTAVISVAVLALIATTAVVAVAQGETSDWQAVRGEAITRIGSEYMGAERDQVADSIANDVTSRGTVWMFMTGGDSGVIYGVGPSAVQSEVQVQTKATTRKVYVSSGHGPLFGSQRVETITAYAGSAVAVTDLPMVTRSGYMDAATYKVTGHPPWLALNDTETQITGGTPTDVGSATVTYTVTLAQDDKETLTDSLTFTIMVVADTEPTLLPIADRTATASSTFSMTLPKAISGNQPNVYSVEITSVDATGLGFDPDNRVLSGAPSVGVFEVTYTVTDANNNMDTQIFTITVEAATS